MLNECQIVIRIGTKLLHHLLSGIRILVGADADPRASEHRGRQRRAAQILSEQAVHERVNIRIPQVQMVHAILSRRKVGTIVGERQ